MPFDDDKRVMHLLRSNAVANRLRANADKLQFLANEIDSFRPDSDYTERRKHMGRALEHTRTELAELNALVVGEPRELPCPCPCCDHGNK